MLSAPPITFVSRPQCPARQTHSIQIHIPVQRSKCHLDATVSALTRVFYSTLSARRSHRPRSKFKVFPILNRCANCTFNRSQLATGRSRANSEFATLNRCANSTFISSQDVNLSSKIQSIPTLNRCTRSTCNLPQIARISAKLRVFLTLNRQTAHSMSLADHIDLEQTFSVLSTLDWLCE